MSTTKSNILYQNSEVSFSCCSTPNQHFPKTVLNPFLHPDNNLDAKDKKISLKKYHADINRQSSYKTLIKPSLIRDQRQTHQIFQNINSEQRGFSPINGNHFNVERPYSHRQFNNQPPNFHEQYNRKVQQKLGNNCVALPQSKMLSKTTKIERILPTEGQELKKTRKTTFNRITNLSELKESVCSYTQSCGPNQKMEQSLILQDYFNPNKAQLNSIQNYLKDKQLKKAQSSVLQPYSMW